MLKGTFLDVWRFFFSRVCLGISSILFFFFLGGGGVAGFLGLFCQELFCFHDDFNIRRTCLGPLIVTMCSWVLQKHSWRCLADSSFGSNSKKGTVDSSCT